MPDGEQSQPPAQEDAEDDSRPDAAEAAAAEPKSSAGPMFSTYGIASTLLGVLSVAAVVLGAMIWSAHRDDSGERTYLTRVMLTAAEWTAVLINMNADNIDASLHEAAHEKRESVSMINAKTHTSMEVVLVKHPPITETKYV
ncbi:hypothetical protein ABLN64_02210, partial [Mycobacterium tuberculosis]